MRRIEILEGHYETVNLKVKTMQNKGYQVLPETFRYQTASVSNNAYHVALLMYRDDKE
jgi:hypothetical protein